MAMKLRIGLNAGEVVVRAIDNDLHMDYYAVGQTTHLAERMEQLATPGSILMTAASLRLVKGLVRVTALGPVKATPYFSALELIRDYGHVEEHDDLPPIRANITAQVLTLDEDLRR